MLAVAAVGVVAFAARAQELSLETAPPVVIKTEPQAGASDVDPKLAYLKVTFSKPMAPASWSWVEAPGANFPKITGKPSCESDQRTCVLPVALEPGQNYAVWLNSAQFKNFKDTGNRPAVPYLLVFKTRR